MAIAEEAFDLVAKFKGSHSGEHGDGIVRSEFHERMYGSKMIRIFETVKDRFDPDAVLNPGKITRSPKMDERAITRWPENYAPQTPDTVFDWTAWPGGLAGAVEMCNNNGACRKSVGGVMCPSFRVTGAEKDLTRGRANVLRLALTGQLGEDAFASDDMADAMALCVGCKACKSECPMSIDMAKMKTEVQAARAAKHGLAMREKLIAALPRMAPIASAFSPVSNLALKFGHLFDLIKPAAYPIFKNPIRGLKRGMCCYSPIHSTAILIQKHCTLRNGLLRPREKPLVLCRPLVAPYVVGAPTLARVRPIAQNRNYNAPLMRFGLRWMRGKQSWVGTILYPNVP